MAFNKVKLGDVVSEIIGGGTPSKVKSEYWNGNIPWASVKDLSDNKYHLDSTQDSITNEGLKNSASNLIKKGTVILPTRMGLGRVVKSGIDLAINQDLKALIPNEKITNDYLLWAIVSVGSKIQKLGTGSTVAGIRLEDLRNIEISLPPLDVQIQISSILRAYQTLIENNEKRIKLLEEMAQRLYIEWFVKFRFPGCENIKLIDNHLMIRKIPETWTISKLGKIVDFVYGKALKADSRNAGNIPVYGSSGIVGFHDEMLAAGPGIIVGRKGNIGAIFWSDSDFYAIDTTYYIRSTVNLHFIYYLLKSINFISSDVAVPGLSRNQVYSIDVVVPEEQIIAEFASLIAPCFKQITTLIESIDKLVQSRDLLISQLVTGKRELIKMESGVKEIL